MQVYAAHDRLHAIHPALIADHVAQWHATIAGSAESVAITTTTAEMARAINERIQAALRRTESDPSLSVPLADGTRAAVGDQVATRRNLHLTTDRGVPVRNRHIWTVVAIGPGRSLTVVHPEQGIVTLPGDYVATAVELGWAVTGYGNQGTTTDHSITVIEPAATRAGVYVGLTRGRHTNTALIPDVTGTLDPIDAVADVLARPTRGETAHAVRDRLHQQHELAAPRADLGTEPPVVRRSRPVLEL